MSYSELIKHGGSAMRTLVLLEKTNFRVEISSDNRIISYLSQCRLTKPALLAESALIIFTGAKILLYDTAKWPQSQIFIAVSVQNNKNDADKIKILIYVMEKSCFTSPTTFTDALTSFEAHFIPRRNII